MGVGFATNAEEEMHRLVHERSLLCTEIITSFETTELDDEKERGR